jgi:hypothetical protein
MTITHHPTINESERPMLVSQTGSFIDTNYKTSYSLFTSNSIYIRQLKMRELRKEFVYYCSIWKSETIYLSSILEITNNSSYRAIIGMGSDVIPLILNDLKSNDNHWFSALKQLTGENPIKDEHKGIFSLMKNDWFQWANEHNLNYDLID